MFNKITFLSLLNLSILSYLALNKYSSQGCSTCQRMNFLTMSDVNIAIAGVVVSLALGILNYFFNRSSIFKYSTLVLSGFAAGFSSFLLTGQLIQFGRISCFLCSVATIGFYLIFCIILINVVLIPTWRRFKVFGNNILDSDSVQKAEEK